MTPAFASIFTGGGLADIGAMQAGYTPIGGVEYIPEIAEIARSNGIDVITANILDCNPAKFECPDWFHASPPCPNFSVAKAGATETALDIALAEKVAEFIAALRPPAVTIENVPAYLKSKSYRVILRALENAGYMYDARVLCAADFGVPQTRRRLIVRAVLGGLVPNLPAPTPWMGWYKAIEDIVDTLPESQFADWQLARLPEFCNGGLFTPNKRDDKANTVRNGGIPRAFVMDGTNVRSNTIRYCEEPYQTVTAQAAKGAHRAWLSQGRVVKMTVQAMGRFQTLPDWYQGATMRIIGNGLPCKLMQAIGEAFLRGQG